MKMDKKELDSMAKTFVNMNEEEFDFFWKRLKFWKNKKHNALKEKIIDMFVQDE